MSDATIELMAAISRVRRATRNADVLAVCDALERFLIDATKGATKVTARPVGRWLVTWR